MSDEDAQELFDKIMLLLTQDQLRLAAELLDRGNRALAMRIADIATARIRYQDKESPK